jgi:hypothetical protein
VTLFAHQPELLVAVTVIALVTGAAVPAFSRLCFGMGASLASGVACGVAALAALAVGLRVMEALASWRERRERGPPGR